MKNIRILTFLNLLAVLLAVPAAHSQTLSGQPLLEALREGGLVIVMRHASSPRELPDAASANADNVNRERQLDETGRADAIAMGEALRRHGITIAEIGSSPTYRALETARLMGFEQVETHEELSNEGMRDSREAYGAWLREQAGQVSPEGNRLLITHAPNMSAGFGEQANGMGEGDALVFKPDGNGEGVLVGRIAIAEWADL